MINDLVVLSAGNVYPYTRGIERIRSRFSYGNCDLKLWMGELPPGSPSQEDNPYAFKAYAFKWAIESGYAHALWIDSVLYPTRDPRPVFDLVRKDGYLLLLNGPGGSSQANWSTDEQLKYFGHTRNEAEKMPHPMANMIGISFKHDVGVALYQDFLTAAQSGVFRGLWWNKPVDHRIYPGASFSNDPRVLGSRHDQTCLGFIAHKHGLRFTSNIVSYEDDDVPFHTNQRFDDSDTSASGGPVVPFVSYTQRGEDVRLNRALAGDVPGFSGFFVDVGANDPTADSVTRALYDRGWRGINIEPDQGCFGELVAHRPRDINLNVGASTEEGALTYYAVAGMSNLSTFCAAQAEDLRKLGLVLEERQVPVVTLSRVLAEHASDVTIDFMSIDVEGHEREVLLGCDWKRFRPRVIVIEATKPMTSIPTHEEWEEILILSDYRFAAFDGLNRFYVRAEDVSLIPSLALVPSFFDGYLEVAEVSSMGRTIAERNRLLQGSGRFAARAGGAWVAPPPSVPARLVVRGKIVQDLNLDLRAYVLTAALDRPFVSCLLVVRGRKELPLSAIDAFRRQSYAARELVIVDDNPDDAFARAVEVLDDPKVRLVRLEPLERSLDDLRNIAIDEARGAYVALWDDEDMHDPERLLVQMAAIVILGADATTFSRRRVISRDNEGVGLSAPRFWEDSLVCDRTKMPRYPLVGRHGNTGVMGRIVARSRVVLLDAPELYTHVLRPVD